MKNKIAVLAVAALAGSASAAVTVYNDFASYNTAVGGIHTYFENFEAPGAIGDVDGNGALDTLGTGFNAVCAYSSPDAGGLSSYVNIGDIDLGIDNEIGPMGSWDLRLQATFATPYYATGFTGIDFEATSAVSFFLGSTLVGTASAGGAGGVFEFFGFVSDTPWDTMVLDGGFYAIDAHYASKVPAPASLGLLGLGALAAGRRRR